MGTEFSFGQIEAVCADLNRIASDKRVAFMGRMKQLQKMGMTEKAHRPGRGKAGTYSFGDLMRFVIAMELIQAGIPPKRAAQLVNGSWSLLRTNIYICSFAPEDTIGFTSKPTQYLWMMDVEALRPLTSEGESEWDHMERIRAVPMEEAVETLTKGVSAAPEIFGESWRTLVLNGFNLTQRVMRVIAFHFGYASREELRQDIEREIHDEDERLRALGDLLEEGLKLPPEEREKLAKKLKETFETDFSTNPPTPKHVYVERAKELMKFLPPDVRTFLEREPTSFELNAETKEILKQLIDLGIINIEMVEEPDGDKLQGIVLTNFGEVLLEEMGGEWAKVIAKRNQERPGEAMDDAADNIVLNLTEEQRSVIRRNGHEWMKEPFYSEFERLGLVGRGEGPLPGGHSYWWTDLGRSVLYSLKYGRNRPQEKAKADGDDQKA
jgi:hypothetical protein